MLLSCHNNSNNYKAVLGIHRVIIITIQKKQQQQLMQTFSSELTFLWHPASLSKSSPNYRTQPVVHTTEREGVRKKGGKKKTKTQSRPGSAFSREVREEEKISFQWSSAETEGISLRSGQRLTVNSDVRTNGSLARMCAGV